jgi:two-component system, response regulator RegA
VVQDVCSKAESVVRAAARRSVAKWSRCGHLWSRALEATVASMQIHLTSVLAQSSARQLFGSGRALEICGCVVICDIFVPRREMYGGVVSLEIAHREAGMGERNASARPEGIDDAKKRLVIIDAGGVLQRSIGRTCSAFNREILILDDVGESSPQWSLADAVVVDICPAGLARVELIQTVRARAPYALICAVTAYPSVALVVAAMKAGASTCLCKPVYPTDILRLLVEGYDQGVQEKRADLPSLGRLEWDYIARILESVDGNISRAARLLGIQRSTLQRKLKKYPPNR